MPRTIYIETTIPSFYYEARTEADMVARCNWTRAWWNQAYGSHILVTSVAVIDELTQGDFPSRDDCLQLIGDLPIVPWRLLSLRLSKRILLITSCPETLLGMRSTLPCVPTIAVTFCLPGIVAT
jgi:hypothetical protein